MSRSHLQDDIGPWDEVGQTAETLNQAKRAPLDFKKACDEVIAILNRNGYEVAPAKSEERRLYAFTAHQSPQPVRCIYVSVKRAGSIWRARRRIEGVAKGQAAKGEPVDFEIWSLHDAHEPSSRDAGGQGCPYGLGESGRPHFLVRRFVTTRVSHIWAPVELWGVR